ncbi:MAG TPA: hypothetical protein PLQ05_03395 [Acidobacteriota bacterium]|jgi:hypothetical protein|nr:hypothetical protein [Acidobacteriota bacterium]HNT16623.1 hypothetical protein [Acidobacteriota bacterium]HPA26674.1 hypothetical protein [Acidobacteriota bacterium]HQO19968.1 hypothetical protein [Acidobacteriota bacterium]
MCPYCSSSIELAPLSPETREACVVLIRSANSNLEQVTTPRLVTTFIAGAILAPILVFFLAGAVGAGKALSFILAGIAVVSGFVVVGMILPVEEDRKFDRELKERIEIFLDKNRMEITEFLSLAHGELKGNAPLIRQLDKLNN